jgi:hypothetical protein
MIRYDSQAAQRRSYAPLILIGWAVAIIGASCVGGPAGTALILTAIAAHAVYNKQVEHQSWAQVGIGIAGDSLAGAGTIAKFAEPALVAKTPFQVFKASASNAVINGARGGVSGLFSGGKLANDLYGVAASVYGKSGSALDYAGAANAVVKTAYDYSNQK